MSKFFAVPILGLAIAFIAYSISKVGSSLLEASARNPDALNKFSTTAIIIISFMEIMGFALIAMSFWFLLSN